MDYIVCEKGLQPNHQELQEPALVLQACESDMLRAKTHIYGTSQCKIYTLTSKQPLKHQS